MTVERLSAADLLQLRTDVGPVPMNIAALLRLGPGASASTVADTLRSRAPAVARLRHVLVMTPPGLGRPYWREDPTFEIDDHVSSQSCPVADDVDHLLELAANLVTSPLPRDRPLWRAVVVTGPEGGEAVAVVIVLHHVLADGMGGLALLADLVDGAATLKPAEGAHSAGPFVRQLVIDRIGEVVGRVRSLPSTWTRVRRGRTELGPGRVRQAPRCSLNRRTGPRRRLSTTGVALDRVRAVARRQGASVNDVLLVAATGAMQAVLRARGEDLPELVVSVPVSARARPDGRLGNHVGVMPVRVPLVGTPGQRLAEVASRTRAQKAATRGASSGLVGPAFGLLAAMGVFQWCIDRQRLVNAFLTNVAGPPQRLSLAGAPITHVLPVTVTAGNVGVAFAALSYAGELTVTVITDPDVVPELDLLTAALREELEVMEPTRAGTDREGEQLCCPV